MTVTKAGNIDAPTILKEVVRVTDAVSKSKSIAKDRTGSGRSDEVPDVL